MRHFYASLYTSPYLVKTKSWLVKKGVMIVKDINGLEGLNWKAVALSLTCQGILFVKHSTKANGRHIIWSLRKLFR